jgi:hypothetical protein
MRMITVKINMPPNITNITDDVLEASYSAFRTLVDDATQIWKDEVGKKLRSTRDDYTNAIQSQMIGDDEAEIYLKQDIWIANALEGGHPSFSIRDNVLKKAKMHTDRKMSDMQRKKMFAYLRSVGRLGLPPTEFSDVPFRNKGSSRQGKPDSYRRISKNTSTESWKHPGFRPGGSGGLDEPLREEVKRQIEEKAPEIFQSILSKVTV